MKETKFLKLICVETKIFIISHVEVLDTNVTTIAELGVKKKNDWKDERRVTFTPIGRKKYESY